MTTPKQSGWKSPDAPGGCPYLGILSDPQTRYRFASPENRCFCVDPPERINQSHQSQVCLSVAFVSCPALEKENPGGLPEEIREPEPARVLQPVHAIMRRYGLLVGIILGAILIWKKPPLAGSVVDE